MREILFKAKTKDTKQWIEGYPYPSITGELRYMTCYDPCCNNQYMVNSYEIDPETVCQYTGLTDKNGKKVFESDIIVAYDENDKWIVSFQSGCWIVETEKSWDFLATNARDIEVIGNIHDEE